MPYEYDIFMSYRRHPETLKWIRSLLLPLLDHYIGLELGRDPRIFVHEVQGQIQAGAIWPVELGEVLGQSRTLVALWCKPYLSSQWCAEELSIMTAREDFSGARTSNNKYGLVVPVILHDGETIPERFAGTQQLDLKPYYNTRMRPDGDKAELLTEVIRRHAGGFAEAIDNAPPFQEHWPQEAARRLFMQLIAPPSSQRERPKFLI